MSNTLKEYRKQAKAEAIEKRSQSGQLQPHPAPSPPVSEYHSTASVDGETEIGDSASQVNQVMALNVSQTTAQSEIKEEEDINEEGRDSRRPIDFLHQSIEGDAVSQVGTYVPPAPSAPPAPAAPQVPPIIKPVRKPAERPEGFDSFFDSPGITRKKVNKDGQTQISAGSSAPSFWTDLLDTVAHIQSQVVEIASQQVNVADAARSAAEEAVAIATSRYKDNAQEVARVAAEEASRRTVEVIRTQFAENPQMFGIGTPQRSDDEEEGEKHGQKHTGQTVGHGKSASSQGQPTIHVTVNQPPPVTHVEIEKDREEVDTKLFKLPKLTCVGDANQNNESLMTFLAKGRMAWEACAPNTGSKLWLRHEAAADVEAVAWADMTADQRAEQNANKTVEVDMSRFEITVHNKLIGETIAKLPDTIYRDCDRFMRRVGDITLADALFRVFKKFKILNVKDRLSIINALVPESCTNVNLYSALSEIQERVTEWRETELLTTDDFSEHFVKLQKLVENRSAINVRLETWGERNRIPSTINFALFERYLRFLIATAEEKYGTGVDLKEKKKDDEKKGEKEKPGNSSLAHTPGARCDYCNKPNHTRQQCEKFRKDQSERDKKLHVEKIAQETLRKAEEEKKKGNGGNGGGQRQPREDRRHTLPCVKMMNEGKCEREGGCAYSHDKKIIDEFKKKVCRDGQNCKRGANCCFGVHETLTLLDEAENLGEITNSEEPDLGAIGHAEIYHGVVQETVQSSDFFGVDSCANVVAACGVPGKEVTGSHSIRTSNGIVTALSGPCSETPVGSAEVVWLPKGSNVIGNNILAENQSGFFWLSDEVAQSMKLPAGPHVVVIKSDGSGHEMIPCVMRGGKPCINKNMLDLARGTKQSRVKISSETVRLVAQETVSRAENIQRCVHETLTASEVSERYPCFGCGSPEHWSGVCFFFKVAKHAFGCFVFSDLGETMMRKILTALSKYNGGEHVKKPVWVWQHSLKFPHPPKPVLDEQVCDVVVKNEMIEMQKWGDAMMPFTMLPDKRSTTLRLFFSAELEEFEEEDGDIITNMPSPEGRVSFSHETVKEFSVFETATALTQLKFTGSPWSEDETRKHLESILEFHRVVTENIDFSIQEKENEVIPEKVEGVNLLIDDVMLGSPKVQETWREIHQDFEGSGVQALPFRYAGIRRREIRISPTAVLQLDDTQESLEMLTDRFFKTTGVPYKPVRNPRPPSVRKYQSAQQEKDSKEKENVDFEKGIFQEIAVSFVLAIAYSASSTRPDLCETCNYLQTLFAKWSVKADLLLIRFARYIRSTVGYALVSIIDSRDRKCAQPLGFPDASWASTDDMKSRLGEGNYIVGRFSIALVKWGTVTMKSICTASQEAEAGALQRTTKNIIVVAESVKHLLCLQSVHRNGREDNQGLLKCLRKGGISNALAHSRRAHGIKLAFLSDTWDQADAHLHFLSGVNHPGDPYTKPLDQIPIHQMMLTPLEADEIFEHEIEVLCLETEEIVPIKSSVLKKEKKEIDWKEYQKQRDASIINLRKIVQNATGVKNEAWASKVLGDLKTSTEKASEHRVVAGQRRKGHAHTGKAEEKRAWRVDTHGPVSPKSWQREKFFVSIRCLWNRYLGCYGMTSHHASQTKDAYASFFNETGELPESIDRDQGRELLGEARQWEIDRNIVAYESEVYRPDQNGGAESDVNFIAIEGKVHLSIGGVENIWWILACQYGVLIANIRNGSFLKVHGENMLRRVLKVLMPFGWRVSFVKEQPQLRAHSGKENFINRAIVGFFAGVTHQGWVRVAYYENGRPKLCETTSCTRLSGFYFGSAPAGFSEVQFRGIHMQKDHLEVLKPQVAGEQAVLATIAELPEFSQGPVTFSCAICKKLRFVKDDFDLGDADVRCSDYGRSCEQPSDPIPENHEIFVGLIDEISEEDQKIADVIHATISVSNKDAWMKYPEKAKKACEKERKKYETAEAYDLKAEDWKVLRKERLDATFVVLAMVWTWAYIEVDGESELKCRICGMGHVQKDSDGFITDGIDLDETLWCVPPSTWQTRVFRTCQALLGNEVESEDFKAAFLQAMLRGPPVYAKIPDEFETADGIEIKKKGGYPVHRVRKAIYGLKRAGQDWSHHASEKFTERKWKSLRELCDGSPSQFVRVVSEPLAKHAPESVPKVASVRSKTAGELATDGTSREAGSGGRNAGTGNGCNPVKVTVKSRPSNDQEVTVVVEIDNQADDDLANQMQNLDLQARPKPAAPPAAAKAKAKATPKAAPKIAAAPQQVIPVQKCSKIVWAKREGIWRNCKWDAANNPDGLCNLHYRLKYGERGHEADSDSQFEDAVDGSGAGL